MRPIRSAHGLRSHERIRGAWPGEPQALQPGSSANVPPIGYLLPAIRIAIQSLSGRYWIARSLLLGRLNVLKMEDRKTSSKGCSFGKTNPCLKRPSGTPFMPWPSKNSSGEKSAPSTPSRGGGDYFSSLRITGGFRPRDIDAVG